MASYIAQIYGGRSRRCRLHDVSNTEDRMDYRWLLRDWDGLFLDDKYRWGELEKRKFIVAHKCI